MIDFNDAPRQSSPFEDAAVRKARVLSALQSRAKEFVRYLYPHAQITARDARIGDTGGAKGMSLSISLTNDETAGRWIDHANGERGDIFGLYAVAHNLDPHRDFAQVLTECDQWAGGTPAPRAEIRHTVEKAKPPEPEKKKTLETRHIYRDAAGAEIAAVCRFRDEDGKKTFIPFVGQTARMPEPRPLYNLDRWHASSHVVLVEGEKCADALTSIGIEATTLMGGANTTIEKTDLKPLAGKTVILWPDHDYPRPVKNRPGEFTRPGYELMERLAGPLRAMGCTVHTLSPPHEKPDGWDAADAISEGFDVLAFIKPPAEPEKPRLPILDVPGLLNVPDPTWIIDGWVIDDGVSVFYGPAKTFKTFNVLDMSLSVACGVPWRGNRVTQAPVLYLLGEGMGTFKYRVHVWLQKRSEGRTAQFWTIPVGVPLSTPEGLANALVAIESLPVMPGMIVVDTLNRHFGPGDENSTQDMTKFVQAIDVIRARTRAHICIVHHSGKDADKGSRGSSALLGAVDNEFRITRTEGTKLCRIECTAARHSDEPKPMTVELVKVEAIHPETGEVMTSLLPVLRSTEEDESDAGPSIPQPAKDVMEAIRKGAKTVFELEADTTLSRSRVQEILSWLRQKGLVYAQTEGKRNIWHVSEQGPTDENE